MIARVERQETSGSPLGCLSSALAVTISVLQGWPSLDLVRSDTSKRTDPSAKTKSGRLPIAVSFTLMLLALLDAWLSFLTDLRLTGGTRAPVAVHQLRQAR